MKPVNPRKSEESEVGGSEYRSLLLTRFCVSVQPCANLKSPRSCQRFAQSVEADPWLLLRFRRGSEPDLDRIHLGPVDVSDQFIQTLTADARAVYLINSHLSVFLATFRHFKNNFTAFFTACTAEHAETLIRSLL